MATSDICLMCIGLVVRIVGSVHWDFFMVVSWRGSSNGVVRIIVRQKREVFGEFPVLSKTKRQVINMNRRHVAGVVIASQNAAPF